MKSKGISTFGYIMNFLKISTVDIAHFLHVDTSLVSKWRTGSRKLTEKSLYYEDIIMFIINNHNDEELNRALKSIFPHENFSGHNEIEHHLRYVLSGNNNQHNFKNQLLFGNAKEKNVTAVCYEGNNGRRRAAQEVLAYAESVLQPADLLFVDTDGFRWLWENENYSSDFIKRLKNF